MVARSPTTIDGTVGFIVIHTNANADAVVVSVSADRYNAARQEDRQRPNSKCEN
jgi:copper(I)-binding protein